MSDQLRVARVVDGFYTNDKLGQLGVVDANMLDQLGLCAGRPSDEDRASVCDGFGDGVKIFVIRRAMPAPDRVRPCDGYAGSDDPDAEPAVQPQSD